MFNVSNRPVTLCLMHSGEQLPELSEKTGASANDRGPAAEADQTGPQVSGDPERKRFPGQSRVPAFVKKVTYLCMSMASRKNANLKADECDAWGIHVMQVLRANQQAQADVAPFLKSPALRTIIKSFTNDEDGDFAKWACNPQVLAMLRQAKELLDEGRMTEEEMMIAFQSQLAVGLGIIRLGGCYHTATLGRQFAAIEVLAWPSQNALRE